jgi:hypothetical protein
MTRADFTGSCLVLELTELLLRAGIEAVDARVTELSEDSVRLAATAFQRWS